MSGRVPGKERAPKLTPFEDLQMVNITCRVLSRPSVDALPTIFRELGTDYDERVLPSIVNGEKRASLCSSTFCAYSSLL